MPAAKADEERPLLRIAQTETAPVDESENATVESQSEQIAREALAENTSSIPQVFEEPAARESHDDLAQNEHLSFHEPVIEEKPIREASSRSERLIDVGVDRTRRVINFRLSYSSVVISSFGLLILVALAFIIGKSAGGGPKIAAAASIADVKKGKPTPGVLNVPAGSKTTANDEAPVSIANAPKAPQTPPTNKNSTPASTPPAKIDPAPKTPAPTPTPAPASTSPNGKRIVGMQYVLIQSYPDPEDAKEACDALNKAGISVTIEKNFYYAPAWSCVITTRGFDRTKSNPEFDAFMKAIRDVNTQYSSNRFHPRFNPTPLAWK